MRIHDRYPSLRLEGFGITLWENGLLVLEGINVYDAAVRNGNPISHIAHTQSATNSQKVAHRNRLIRVSRGQITQALADEATKAGAELVFNSAVAGADPAGALIMEDGRRLEADLVIGADGVNSRVRSSLNLVRKHKMFDCGAMRIIVNRSADDISDEERRVSSEMWSGKRRLISGLCGQDEHYLALVCNKRDEVGKARPMDVESWARSFPDFARVFDQARREVDWSNVAWANFQDVRLKSWSNGVVAIVGDAAHAMPPNLGQGGNCAMMSALALAEHVNRTSDLAVGLAEWERVERPVIEHVQSWSSGLERLTKFPPFVRSIVFWMIGNISALHEQHLRGANHAPTGAPAQTAGGHPTLAMRRQQSAGA